MEFYIFGTLTEAERISEQQVKDIVKQAKELTRQVARIDIDTIIDIFDNVANAWLDEDYTYRKQALEFLPSRIGFSEAMITEGIKTMASLLSRDGMLTRLYSDLGDKNYLSQWSYNHYFRGYIRTEPLGVVTHVSAGNVFVGGVDSLIQGLVSKNVNIMKMSTVDPVFPVLFAKSLRDHDTTGLLHKAMALVNWKGGTESIENILKQECDAIVAYGGADTIRSYRKNLGLHCKLIEYGPKYSFVMVDEEEARKKGIEETARLIARDVIMWEQSACSSPHTVYVEGEDFARRMMREIGMALEHWADEIPQGTVYDDEAVEITKVREMAKVNKAFGKDDYYFCKNNLGTVVYQSSPEFQISCHNRTIFVKPVASLEDVVEIVAPMGQYIQTVSILADEERAKKLAGELALIGADRFVEIGRMAVRKHGTPHDGSKGIAELVRWVSLGRNTLESDWQIEALWERYDPTADGFDFLPDEERDRQTLGRLIRIVDIVREKSPLLKERYRDIRFDSFEGFRKLPLMTGEDYKKHLPPAGDGILTDDIHGGYIFSSGGTTGTPKSVYRTVEEEHFNTVRLGKGLALSVFDKYDRVANLLFAGNMWASFVSYNQALEHAGCTILPIGGNHSIESIVQNLITFNANALISIPSVLLSVAEYVETHNIDLKIKKISSGGEHLFKESRAYLKKVLGVEVIASTGYTTNDTGAIGYQCKHQTGTNLHHVHEDLHYVEILDVETNEPVAPGEVGKVVVTNLQRTLMPTIRYEVGDLCRWVESECACGRKTRILELLGRSDDIVIIGGGNITPDVISAALAGFPGISAHFQMLVSLKGGKDHLKITAEAKEEHFEDVSDRLRERILKLSKELKVMIDTGLIYDVEVEIVKPNSLKRNPKTGKITLIKDEREIG
jgi:phenylacetate-coenzyme A ligase PaaK-like adenylate-forming protein/acyl-CoA reductase-like NAD-dependent aldehyde dehydrogenase